MLLHPGLYLPMKTDFRSLVLKILVLRNSFDIDREMGPWTMHGSAFKQHQAHSGALPAIVANLPKR